MPLPTHQGGPSTEGDGTTDQPGPYTPPPEALDHLNGAPVGSLIDATSFASKIYAPCEFEYRVYVPAQYASNKPAAFMVFQDGSLYVGTHDAKFNSATVFDNLIHTGAMPVTIGLFINPGKPGPEHDPAEHSTRSDQYDVLDDKYSRFLLEEIIPEVITGRYEITADPEGWAIAGFSSGGICAFNVAWHRPDKFRKVLTHNGSFTNIKGGHVYPQLIRDAPTKPLRVSLLSGTGDIADERGSWFEANADMAHALSEKGYPCRYRPGTGGHYPPIQAVADYADALRWLWQGYRLAT
jgi:enterochelin esterase family protein